MAQSYKLIAINAKVIKLMTVKIELKTPSNKLKRIQPTIPVVFGGGERLGFGVKIIVSSELEALSFMISTLLQLNFFIINIQTS
jgi:hypothetical protein